MTNLKLEVERTINKNSNFDKNQIFSPPFSRKIQLPNITARKFTTEKPKT